MRQRTVDRPIQQTHGIQLSLDKRSIDVVKFNLHYYRDTQDLDGTWHWMKRKDSKNISRLRELVRNTRTFRCMNFAGIDKTLGPRADEEALRACPGLYRFSSETRDYYVIKKCSE